MESQNIDSNKSATIMGAVTNAQVFIRIDLVE